MMPFSPLRTWGLGLLSWALIGIGVYCIWQWAESERPVVDEAAAPRTAVAENSAEADATRTDRPAEAQPGAEPPAAEWRLRENPYRWVYLAVGIALLSWSLLGFLPITLLLGRPGRGSLKASQPGHSTTVERPDGTRLHVESFGPKSGPTIVFTHGWSLDSSVWGYQLQDLADQYRVVTWDLPGLGKSKGPDNGDYSLEKMANDLEAVIQAAGKGPIILVGHSIGGMIAQTYCRLHPKQLGPRVAGIVLLYTTYTNPLRTAFLAPLWTAIEKPVLVPLNHLTVWLAPLAWLSNMQSFANGTLHIATRIASFAGDQSWGELHHGAWLAAKSWPGVVARGNLAMLNFEGRPTLPEIDIPVLVIASKYDRMTKPEAGAFIEQKLPQGALTTVPAGHLGCWEQRVRVSELLTEFVERFREPATADSNVAAKAAAPQNPE